MNFWQHAITHWKSTATGICTFAIVTCGVLIANPQTREGKVGSYAALILALGTAYIGAISKDAGVQESIVPGPTPGMVEIKAEPSHETPDNPAAVAVKGKDNV